MIAGLVGSGVAGGRCVEAIKQEVEVVGDFGCEAVYAGHGAQAYEGCDQRVLDEVLAGVFGCEAAKCRKRALERAGAGRLPRNRSSVCLGHKFSALSSDSLPSIG